ncbi:MAG: hypothetical protein DCC58_12250 [Chloroflexi bacterium]|nr:MAG: hypothetical protein DCC58_12250 [Chloroflexota bacterium]
MEVSERSACCEKAFTAGQSLLQIETGQFGPKRSKSIKFRFLAQEFPGLDEWLPHVRLRVSWNDAAPWLDGE